MTNFITKVVKNPLDEVNEKTNLTVSFDKIKDGKNVVGFRFNCSEKAASLQITKDNSQAELDEIKVINEEQAELQYFKTHYPEEFAAALKLAKQQNELPFGDSFEIAYEADAVDILKKQGLK